jgi:glycosyltransferase involved in cell wall biosynthesis
MPVPSSDADAPLVSCVVVTANRPQLLRRSVRCFNRQRYANRELVVLDDGDTDLTPALADVPAHQLRYTRIAREPDNVLGALRNRSLDLAQGDVIAQWDDDDWYDAERLAVQVGQLQRGADACTISATLMHLNTPEFLRHPYVGHLRGGVPGTIVHRRDDAIRYPAQRRAEDSVYLDAWRRRTHVDLPDEYAHLFIRTFHGANTWEQQHFHRRLRNSVPRTLRYLWYRYVKGDLFAHPKFRLGAAAEAAFALYLEDSFDLGLLHA